MKNLFIIFFCLICYNVVAQVRYPTGVPTQFSTGWFRQGYSMADSGTIIANRDTTWKPKFSGTVVFRPNNRQFYYFDSTLLAWFPFGINVDTTSLSNRINQKLNIVDTTNKWWGKGKRFVDTVYRVNDSTIGFTVNGGIQQTFQILGRLPSGGGSGTVTSVALSMPSAFSVSGSPITSTGSFNISGAGTTLQYIRGNGTLATTDTSMIQNFYLKTRSLFSATSPLTYNSTTGIFGIGDANTAGTKGVATFNANSFDDNGFGLISLSTLISPGTCTNCTVNFGADGRAIGYSNGVGPTSMVVDTIYRTPGIDSIYFTINSVVRAIKDSVGAGGSFSNNNVGGGFRWVATPAGNIKTAFSSNTIIWDSVSNANGLTPKVDTSVIATKFDISAKLNSSDTTNKWINNIRRLPGSVNVEVFKNGAWATAYQDSVGIGSVTQINTGYGLSGGPITTIGTIVVDTLALKSVYLPLNLNSSKTVNQATNNITFSGGGQIIFDSTRYTQTYISPTLLSDSLVTFGNSITAGSNATVQDSAYVNRVASYYGLPLTNKGVPSTVAYQACASNLDYINPGHTAMVTFCIGLNDFRTNGNGVGGNMYRGVKNAYEAAMVNHYIASYIPASSCNLFGTWNTNFNAKSSSGGKTTMAAYTANDNDSLTVNITGTGVGIGILGIAGSAGSAVIYIDGVKVDSFNTSNQTFATGTQYQSMGKYYTGLSNTSHHVKIVKQAGGVFLLIDYVGALVPTSSMQPFVFVHVPHMDSTGYAGGSATQAIIDAGNDSLTAAYNRALAAGLNVYLAKTNNYYNASTSSGLSGDHIHPNNLGMYQIFSAIRAGLSAANSIPGTIRYSNDGHLYATKIDNSLNQIPYTQDLNLQRVLTNGSYLTNPNTISGTNTLNFNGFSDLGLGFLHVKSNNTAYVHGLLGVQGPLGGLFIGARSVDTTKGFSFYSDGARLNTFDNYNGRGIISSDTSYRNAFYNNAVTNTFVNPTATIHIGGNTTGAANHAPLKIDSCTLLITPERYAIEATADSLYWTNYAGIRVALNRNAGAATTIYNGNGTLSGPRLISTGGNRISFNGANNSDTIMIINNTGTSGTGLYAFGSSLAINAQSTNTAITAFGSTRGALLTGDASEGAIIKSNTIRGLNVQSVPASNNTIQEVLRLDRSNSGGPGATGIGGSIDLVAEDASSAAVAVNQIIWKLTDAANATKTSQLYITGYNAGSSATIFTLDGNGTVTTTGKRVMAVTTSSAGTLTLSNAEGYIFNGTTTTWTLPAVSGTTGTIYYIKNVGSGAITLNTTAAANEIYTTSAVNTTTITAGSAIILISNGTYWTVN